jgi:hypothetical protein
VGGSGCRGVGSGRGRQGRNGVWTGTATAATGSISQAGGQRADPAVVERQASSAATPYVIGTGAIGQGRRVVRQWANGRDRVLGGHVPPLGENIIDRSSHRGVR